MFLTIITLKELRSRNLKSLCCAAFYFDPICLIQYLSCLFHQVNDGKMLRAYALTLAAADTIGSFAAPLRKLRIEILGPQILRVTAQGVYCPENIGNAYQLRASGAAILAGGTSDLRHPEKFFRHFVDNS